MIMPPGIRKFALTAHVTVAVGWVGAAVCFLGLAAVGLTSRDEQTVRGAYLVMEPAAWFVLVPLAIASLLTGIVMSLGTTGGIFRHYWVVFKLVISTFATIVLLVYMETFRFMAGVAANPNADLNVVRNASPMLHAVLALLLLIVATVLAVYKPRGFTRYGWRKQHEERMVSRPIPTQSAAARRERDHTRSERKSGRPWRRYVLFIIVGVILLLLLLHLVDGGIPRH